LQEKYAVLKWGQTKKFIFMPPIPIIPRYKLVIIFDIRPDHYESYYHFLLSEFIPGLQQLELYPFAVWHTAYGEYPLRQTEFVIENMAVAEKAFASEEWGNLETQLKEHTENYTRKLINFRNHFQF
jgi:hypothetical protein